MKMTKLFNDFFNSEKSGGMVLIVVTIISLLLANSALQSAYTDIWDHEIGGHSTVHWINDGLMTIFFLMIGLELEREIYIGELSSIKNASLPVLGALGGMLVPAGIFLLFNYGTNTQSGAGIPMATDIAFAIGILSLLGKRVPTSLKIFLTALAVIDDLGAIMVIAIFYTNDLDLVNLSIAGGIFAGLLVLNRLKVFNIIPYLLGGGVMWYFMLHSGIHATITGVLVAFAIPFGKGDHNSISYKLQHLLHRPVAFIILPLFALANTCIQISGDWYEHLADHSSLGIIIGLVVGKPIGICLFAMLGISLGICTIPKGLKMKQLLGAGMLGGIGFTMSIFITLLAFEDNTLINSSKIAILMASSIAAILGFIWLKISLPKQTSHKRAGN
jgi:NhaA family Na+:H+ antiporter